MSNEIAKASDVELKHAIAGNISFIMEHLELNQSELAKICKDTQPDFAIPQKTFSLLSRPESCTPTTATLVKILSLIKSNWIPDIDITHLMTADGIKNHVYGLEQKSKLTTEPEEKALIKAINSVLNRAVRMKWLVFLRESVSSELVADLIIDDYKRFSSTVVVKENLHRKAN